MANNFLFSSKKEQHLASGILEAPVTSVLNVANLENASSISLLKNQVFIIKSSFKIQINYLTYVDSINSGYNFWICPSVSIFK